jgi:cysteine-rich repeat protein
MTAARDGRQAAPKPRGALLRGLRRAILRDAGIADDAGLDYTEEMRTSPGGVQVVAAVLAAVTTAACLDRNPKFEEPLLPTSSDSGGATTMVSPTTTATPPLTGTTTEDEDEDTEDTETLTTSYTTDGGAVCGDGKVEGGEECDEGADNADDGACTTLCKPPGCGDTLLQPGEACDDGNAASDDGCVACVVPRTCAEILLHDANAISGPHVLDVDGPEPEPPVAVYCDMTTTGGGWTVVERSAQAQPIGVALFKDMPVNLDLPGEAPFRLGRTCIDLLVTHSSEMRIDCGGADYLLTDAQSILAGEMGGPTCENRGKILYKEARLKDHMLMDVELCTGFLGAEDGCEGAWHIDESTQYLCEVPPYPWDFMVPVTSEYADSFAVDAEVLDTVGDPLHDCHVPGAVRVVMLR